MSKLKLVLSDINNFTGNHDGELFDAVLTDAPYELGFMGRDWDKAGVSFNPKTWLGIRNLLRPGGHLLSFGGTRTYHRIAVAIEDGGFEIRDCIGFAWCYGSGFPKSYNIGKATGEQAWEGFGTALKPAWEPIVLAMNPLDGTFANNAMTHGISGINIDGIRIPAEKETGLAGSPNQGYGKFLKSEPNGRPVNGRWPTNFILDEEAAKLLDEQSGQLTSGTGAVKKASASGHQGSVYGTESRPAGTPNIEYGDTGGASRFFYQAKAHKSERHAGVIAAPDGESRNNHPTVKPIELTKYLATMLLPPDTGRPRRILVPFCGSGSEMIGAMLAGWDEIVGVDRQDISIAGQRLHWWGKMMTQLHTTDVQKILQFSFPEDYAEETKNELSDLPLFKGIA